MFLKYQEKNKQEKLEIEKQLAKSGNRCSNLENIIIGRMINKKSLRKTKALWEHTGSNRGPSACKADALNQLSYAPFFNWDCKDKF